MARRAIVLVMLLAIGLAGWLVWPAGGQALRLGQLAPDIAGAPWINSPRLTMESLRGRVVLVEFWTYGCVNCQRVIPQLRAWHDTYEAAGLTIVGVHTPEFFWEKPYAQVVAATERFGIRYPVVQDNDTAIWKRFGIWAWPTAVLVDKKGIVRYHHIGEGEYEHTEAVIRRLLAE